MQTSIMQIKRNFLIYLLLLIPLLIFSQSSNFVRDYQCQNCGIIVSKEMTPNELGCTNSGWDGKNRRHFWWKINDKREGYQCEDCGVKCYTEAGTPDQKMFGGCRVNNNSGHYWGVYKKILDNPKNIPLKTKLEVTKSTNSEKNDWWNKPSDIPKWVNNYTCINDVGWYSKTDREDKIQVRTPDGEDYLYLYEEGKVIYENKVKAILNGTWKCVEGKLYIKTDDGYEWTKKSGWRRQGAKPIPDWAENCIWEAGDVESCDSVDKVKVSTNDGEDNLYFYKSGKFVYEDKVKNTLNGTWKCVSGKLYINTDDGDEYTKDGGWVKKQ